jgi:hypothetical protein
MRWLIARLGRNPPSDHSLLLVTGQPAPQASPSTNEQHSRDGSGAVAGLLLSDKLSHQRARCQPGRTWSQQTRRNRSGSASARPSPIAVGARAAPTRRMRSSRPSANSGGPGTRNVANSIVGSATPGRASSRQRWCSEAPASVRKQKPRRLARALTAFCVRAAAVPRATGVIQSWFPAVLGSAETLIDHNQDSGATGSSATERRCARVPPGLRGRHCPQLFALLACCRHRPESSGPAQRRRRFLEGQRERRRHLLWPAA